MLTNAYVCRYGRRRTTDQFRHLIKNVYADVLLTYADECLRMQVWKEAHAQFRDLVKNHQPMEI
jgi:ABC-type transporter MlaC component